MPEPTKFGEKPCRWYWEIGSGRCDNCGRFASEHEGVVVLAPDSGPLLWGTDDGGWVAYSWSEWDARVASGARVREARKLLSELSDAEAVAAAAALVAAERPSDA